MIRSVVLGQLGDDFVLACGLGLLISLVDRGI